MHAFIRETSAGRVVFGPGSLKQLPNEVERLGLERVLVLSTPAQAQDARKLADNLGARVADMFPHAVMHTPVDVTAAALGIVEQHRVDGVLALGGGSAIGLGKAIAVRTDLPQIVVPTTYAGSEMTPILGETQDGAKTTRSSPAILPEVVIYDVELTLSLPAGLSGASGMNAMAHAVEALYAREADPITSLLAAEGVRAFVGALPVIMQRPHDLEARTDALYGTWLCGIALGSAGMSLHHKLCHTLGGMFDLSHAETHAAVLPHALAYNAPSVGPALELLRPALGEAPPRALYDLARQVCATVALRDLGMPKDGIGVAVERTLDSAYWNPRPLERKGLIALLTAAWAGEPPA